jgi:hypothetical protein
MYAVQCVTVPVLWLTGGQVVGHKQMYAVQCVTVPVLWLTGGQVIGHKQMYAVQCVTVAVCWLTGGQVIGHKQMLCSSVCYSTGLLADRRASDLTQTDVCSSVCYSTGLVADRRASDRTQTDAVHCVTTQTIDLQFRLSFVIFPLLHSFSYFSTLLVGLRVLSVLGLCVVHWEKSLEARIRPGVCTVLAICDYCSSLGSVFWCYY